MGRAEELVGGLAAGGDTGPGGQETLYFGSRETQRQWFGE